MIRPRAVIGTSAVLTAGACLVLTGCSGGSSGSSGTAGGVGSPPEAGLAAPSQARNATAGRLPVHLAALPSPTGQAIIYTASLTMRAQDVRAAAAQAARLASAAGGYVSSEATRVDHAHPARATVRIQLKIPAPAYQSTLAVLASRLGSRISLSQHAQDVTQTVADVTSRVASARAAIAQLRKLLARAGSVSSLLAVQDQINQEESDLEALQSEQRALAHETTYATVSVLLVSRRPPPAARPVKLAGGFTGGLTAGWHALRQVTSWVLTGLGAVLPFAVFVVLAAVLAVRGRRWLARRRAGAAPAE